MSDQYIVLERNQAGGRLALSDHGELHDTREEAVAERDWHEWRSRSAGRRDTYMVATVTIDEEDL